MRRRRHHQAGVSLLEIMVTLFLVGIGLLVVMTSFIAISRSGHYSERMDIATTLSRLEMERIRNMPYANITAVEGAYNQYPDHPDFRRQIEVSETGTIKEVVVRIFFDRDRRRTEVRTFVSNM